METRTSTPSTSKVRRDVTGGKRGDGHLRTEPVRRPDPRRIRTRPTEQPLTAVAGLVPFGCFLRDIGVDAELGQRFASLKDSSNVVYPMAAQMRLLLDAITVGGDRVFEIEALAAHPLFVHLAGGIVPSLLDLRVIAVRTVDPANGKPCYLWPGLDASAQVFITSDWAENPIDVMRRYNLRAGIEPMIGEVKYGWGLGKMPSQCFEANHASLLLKLLAFNLMRCYLATHHPELQTWRVPWLRRALLRVPGRLSLSGRKLTLNIPARSKLARRLN